MSETNEVDTCVFCDAKKERLYEQHLRKIRELQEEFVKQLEALAKAHVERKHGES